MRCQFRYNPPRDYAREVVRAVDDVGRLIAVMATRSIAQVPRRRREKGTCSVYRRGDRWLVAMELPKSPDGKRRHRYWTCRTEPEAKRKAQAIQIARDRLTRDAGRQTLATFLRRYLSVTAPALLRPRTLAGYVQTIEAHVLPYIGTLTLEALTVADLRHWQHRLTEDGVSPRTRRYARAVLRASLQHAVIDGTIDTNPAAVLPMARAARRKGRALTLPELAALLAAAGEDPLGPFVRVVLGLGLRAGEALAVRREDLIDTPAGRMLRVERQVQRLETGLEVVPLKSDESHRLIPVHADVVAAVEAQAALNVALRKAAGPRWQEHGLLFPSSLGTLQDHRNITRRWHALRAKAGLGAIRLHDLRHGYATLLRQSGTDLRTVSELLGHSGIGITDQFYGHLVPQLHHQAADKLAALFAGAKVTPASQSDVSLRDGTGERPGEPAGRARPKRSR